MTGRGSAIRTGLAGVLLAASVVVVMLRLAGDPDPFSMLDLRVYQDAVIAWTHGQPVYSLTYTPVGLPFTYPPFGLVALAWTAPLSFAAAAGVLTAASVLGLGLVALAVGRRLGWGPATAMLGAGAALWLEPVRATLAFGQVNLVLLALVACDALLVPERFRGVLTGVATAIKLTPGIFLLYFLLTGQRRAAGRQIAAAVVVSLLSVAVTPGSSLAYWTRLVFDNRAGAAIYMRNQALSGLVGRALGPSGPVTAVTLLASLIALGLGLLAVRACMARGELVGAFAATATAGLLISPISWDHHWVWALPLLAVMLARPVPPGGLARPRSWGRLARPRSWGRLALGLMFAAVLAIGPQTLLPSADDREYAWTWWQVVVGDLFPLLALACLGWLAFARPQRAGAVSRAVAGGGQPAGSQRQFQTGPESRAPHRTG